MPNINELTLAKELIKFPSVTPKDAGAIGFLAKQLKSIGFICKILEFKEEVGDFGTLLYAGHDWADVDLAKNSMKLMAEKVMPKINKHSKIAAE